MSKHETEIRAGEEGYVQDIEVAHRIGSLANASFFDVETGKKSLDEFHQGVENIVAVVQHLTPEVISEPITIEVKKGVQVVPKQDDSNKRRRVPYMMEGQRAIDPATGRNVGYTPLDDPRIARHQSQKSRRA